MLVIQYTVDPLCYAVSVVLGSTDLPGNIFSF